MIKLKQPALAINSNDVPGPEYRMWDTWDAPEGIRCVDLVARIAASVGIALVGGKTLNNVVINCHGADGGGALWIGGDGVSSINSINAAAFAVLKPFAIPTIWLVACQAAAGNSGKALCRQIATAAGSQVIASEDDQEVGVMGTLGLAFASLNLDAAAPAKVYTNVIDEFEGRTFLFQPTGSMVGFQESWTRGVA